MTTGSGQCLQRTASARRRVVEDHYALPEHLFTEMLGRTMVYSCAYFSETDDLDVAQETKMRLIGRKLGLGHSLRFLDVGCGWGSLAKFSASEFGCQAVGVNLSQKQLEYAQREPAARVQFVHSDYRSMRGVVAGQFEAIASIGLLEHVGPPNYPQLSALLSSMLTRDGALLLQTVGSYRSAGGNAWVKKYVFPNSVLPSLAQIVRPFSRDFVVGDIQNLRPHYSRTLQEWWKRFSTSSSCRTQLTDRFRRMWEFYLLGSAGAFLAMDRTQVWQILLFKRGSQHSQYVRER